jgi:hypothetical protein
MWYGAAKRSVDELTVLRKFTLFLFIVALFVAPILVRVVTESHRALEAARAAVARGDLDAGFAAYEEAIRWSCGS